MSNTVTPRKVTARGATPLNPPARKKTSGLAFKLSQNDVESLKRVGMVMLTLILLVALIFASRIVAEKVNRPITHVKVQGNLNYVSQQAVEERLVPYLTANFFDLNLTAITNAIDDMPWVEQAEVSRVWPDSVIILLQEQVPVARWGESSLLNHKGETFQSPDIEKYKDLPLLAGPKRSTRTVMEKYEEINGMLAKVGMRINRLEMQERGSWSILVDNGLEIYLGRDKIQQKMQRFLDFYQGVLKTDVSDIARVDLRYMKGVAVTQRTAPTNSIEMDTAP